ncbi:hypothetical protein A7A78_01650 [Aequorivita soesokkakensis]|uniref:Uncharacterized protein n=1 Tax=Aequorivita soesokkakensis TaxID=1385699 RepID=A0A1A9LGY3_9FLAO|nr:hypothetical protein [Aequorivita soesokkakensis]OAD92639.1 hypothetical protein A7A78_01650 [Aequorivita soesokkakensis]
MAKQVGVIRLKGTIGDVTYYRSKNGGDLARAAGGGYTSESVKNSPSMVRTRENASEFGHCSSVKKHFRLSLAPFLCVRKDGTLHKRMMTLFTELKKMDPVSERGQRNVGQGLTTVRGKNLLGNFNFTPACNVAEVLGATLHYDFVNRILEVTNFDIHAVSFPSGATHMALTLGLLHFDFDTLKYQLKTSVPFYFDKNYSGDSFQLGVDLPDVSGTSLAVLGMKFYDKVGETFYLFKSANAVGIGNLGVF